MSDRACGRPQPASGCSRSLMVRASASSSSSSRRSAVRSAAVKFFPEGWRTKSSSLRRFRVTSVTSLLMQATAQPGSREQMVILRCAITIGAYADVHATTQFHSTWALNPHSALYARSNARTASVNSASALASCVTANLSSGPRRRFWASRTMARTTSSCSRISSTRTETGTSSARRNVVQVQA
jgi:hypothetical protein